MGIVAEAILGAVAAAMRHVGPAHMARGRRALLVVMLAAAAHCASDQVWLSQGVVVHPSDKLRVGVSNTLYIEHGEHFSNEEAGYFRWTPSSHWAAGGGASWSQDRIGMVSGETGAVRHHWDRSSRPTEHVAIDWMGSAGGWSFLDSNRIYLYFRSGERDWGVYRNIATVTAPQVPRLPWKPRPYFTQFVYVTGRDGYDGIDCFSQFRWVAGVGMRPLERLSLVAYLQYRDIETDPGEWTQVRVAGLSASLIF